MISNIDEFDAKRAAGEATIPASEEGGQVPHSGTGANEGTATDVEANAADGDLHEDTPQDGDNPGALPPSGGTTTDGGTG